MLEYIYRIILQCLSNSIEDVHRLGYQGTCQLRCLTTANKHDVQTYHKLLRLFKNFKCNPFRSCGATCVSGDATSAWAASNNLFDSTNFAASSSVAETELFDFINSSSTTFHAACPSATVFCNVIPSSTIDLFFAMTARPSFTSHKLSVRNVISNLESCSRNSLLSFCSSGSTAATCWVHPAPYSNNYLGSSSTGGSTTAALPPPTKPVTPSSSFHSNLQLWKPEKCILQRH